MGHYDERLHGWYAAPGRYELRLGHSSRDIRITVPLQFETQRFPPLTVDGTTPLGLLLADPRTAVTAQKLLDGRGGDGDGLMPPEAMAQMLDATPLRELTDCSAPDGLLAALRRDVDAS